MQCTNVKCVIIDQTPFGSPPSICFFFKDKFAVTFILRRVSFVLQVLQARDCGKAWIFWGIGLICLIWLINWDIGGLLDEDSDCNDPSFVATKSSPPAPPAPPRHKVIKLSLLSTLHPPINYSSLHCQCPNTLAH